MPKTLRIALAASVVAILFAATADAALNTAFAARRAAPQPAPQSNAIPYSYQGYGLGAECANQPFSRGCDRRGTW